MKQIDMWPGPGARNSDPETSHAAANRATISSAIDRGKVLAVHASHPEGLTDFELATIMGRQQTSVGKRRGELRDLGLIEASESTRPAPSGSSAIVWRITSEGLSRAKGET